MEILMDFINTLYDIFKIFLHLGTSLAVIYIVFYFILKIICCGNTKSDYKQLRKSVNGGCMNYAKAFYEISVAHLDSAKLYAENILLRNRTKRKNQTKVR